MNHYPPKTSLVVLLGNPSVCKFELYQMEVGSKWVSFCILYDFVVSTDKDVYHWINHLYEGEPQSDSIVWANQIITYSELCGYRFFSPYFIGVRIRPNPKKSDYQMVVPHPIRFLRLNQKSILLLLSPYQPKRSYFINEIIRFVNKIDNSNPYHKFIINKN